MEDNQTQDVYIKVPVFSLVKCHSCAAEFPRFMSFEVIEKDRVGGAPIIYDACSMRCAEDIRLKVDLIRAVNTPLTDEERVSINLEPPGEGIEAPKPGGGAVFFYLNRPED